MGEKLIEVTPKYNKRGDMIGFYTKKREEKMKEKDFPGKILDLVWRMEKKGVDFHRGMIKWEEFEKPFMSLLLEMVSTLINLKLLKQKKGG